MWLSKQCDVSTQRTSPVMSASSKYSFASFSVLGSASEHLLDRSDVSSGVIMFFILPKISVLMCC